MEALERAHGADPRRCPFAFFSRDDFVGGAGMFHWYPTLAALLEALGRDLAYAFFDDGPDEAATVAGELAAALSGVTDLRDLDESRTQMLRASLTGVQDLQWVGTFTQLCESDDEWVSEVRIEFRECVDEVGDGDVEPRLDSARPIACAEVPDFIAFLSEYGF